MTKAEDKAADARQEKAIDKADAAHKTYETEQAAHEKTHPGEIDEPAYREYEKAYDKIPEDRVAHGTHGSHHYPPAAAEAPPVVDHYEASQTKPKNFEPLSTAVNAVSFSFVNTDYTAENKMWKVVVGFTNQADAKALHDALATDQVMIMKMSAANVLAMQLAKPVPGAAPVVAPVTPAPAPVVAPVPVEPKPTIMGT